MASFSARSATLRRHSAAAGAEGVTAIEAALSRTASHLVVSYALEGEFARLRIPPPRAPRFVEGLWQHTCFELFVKPHDADAYHELNFSPSGEWAVYAFDRYRERRTSPAHHSAPAIELSGSRSRLQLDVSVLLPDVGYHAESPLRIGVSAVLEDLEGELSYWALAHPAARPDFHHPDSFVLQL